VNYDCKYIIPNFGLQEEVNRCHFSTEDFTRCLTGRRAEINAKNNALASKPARTSHICSRTNAPGINAVAWTPSQELPWEQRSIIITPGGTSISSSVGLWRGDHATCKQNRPQKAFSRGTLRFCWGFWVCAEVVDTLKIDKIATDF